MSEKEKFLAVELDPPAENKDARALAFLEKSALDLRRAGASLITMADNPCARARGDSALLASLIQRTTGVRVMPHITCRDRNVLALKSALLGLDMAGIHEVLAVTGDPVASEDRSSVKSRAVMNSSGLVSRIAEWNDSLFSQPFILSSSLNINAVNFDAEMRKCEKKAALGVTKFFTQPILSDRGVQNTARAGNYFPLVIAGILPVVSYRNAEFLEKGINGIHVSGEVRESYRECSKEECRSLSVSISLEFAEKIKHSVQGYCVITPFRRVDIVLEIIRSLAAFDRKILPQAASLTA